MSLFQAPAAAAPNGVSNRHDFVRTVACTCRSNVEIGVQSHVRSRFFLPQFYLELGLLLLYSVCSVTDPPPPAGDFHEG